MSAPARTAQAHIQTLIFTKSALVDVLSSEETCKNHFFLIYITRMCAQLDVQRHEASTLL
jgi:hypothetical protein